MDNCVTSFTLLAACIVALALPLAALAMRRLGFRRDLLFLALYLQSVLYVQIGPYAYLRRNPGAAGLLPDYETLGVASLVLFSIGFLVVYIISRGEGRNHVQSPGSPLEVRGRRVGILSLALLSLAASFWAIAWSHDLVFRRIGNTIVAKQLTLSFPEFFVYRLYIESIWFMVAIFVVVLLIGRARLSWIGWSLVALNLFSAYAYLVINTRIGLALALTMTLGLWALVWRGVRGYGPRLALGTAAAAMLLLYSTSTTERIRVGFAHTGAVSWRAFLPGLSLEERRAAGPGVVIAEAVGPEGSSASGKVRGGPLGSRQVQAVVSQTLLYRAAAETPLALRLNGLDLMARMKPALESQGFAWGLAWKVPIELVYLPLLDPAKARDLKLSLDMAAKNYLMREYTDIGAADYFSCMLTDAYGNFGYPGIALVGVALGAACGFSVRVMRRPTNVILPVIALFAVSHLFQFEQEFVTALVLWVKKVPILFLVLILNPFRVVRKTPSAA